MKSVLASYNNALVRNIDDLFRESLPVLTALSIFDPIMIPSTGNVKLYGHARD